MANDRNKEKKKNEEARNLESEIKKLQRENISLKNQLNEFEDIYDNSSIGFYKTTPKGNVLYANKMIINMLGYSSLNELKNDNIIERQLIDNISRQSFVNILNSNGFIEGHESVWFDKFGQPLYVKESAKIVKEKSGNIKYYIGTIENLTSQKEKEIELKIAEEKYHNLNNFLPVGIVLHRNSKIIYINDFVQKLLKAKSKNDIIGQSIYKYVHKDYHSLATNRIKNILEANVNSEPIEQIFIDSQGKHFDVSVMSTAFYLDSEFTVLSVFMDISTKKQSERNSAMVQLSYENVFGSLREAVIIQDFMGNVLNCNQAASNMFGYNLTEFVYKSNHELFEPDISESRLYERMSGSSSGTSNVDLGFYTGIKKGGEKFPVELSFTKTEYFGEDALVIVARDVSKLKAAEAMLLHNEKKYRELIRFSAAGILVGSAKGYILEANQHICDLMGRKKSDIIGKHITDGFFTEESLKKNPLDFDSLKMGKTVVNQRQIKRPDNTSVWVEMHTKQFPDKTYQSVYHDISYRKQVEQELLKSKHDAEVISQKQESLLKAMPDTMFAFDKDGYIIDFYSNSKDSFDIPKNKVVGLNLTDFMSQASSDLIKKKIKKVLSNKKTQSFSFRNNIQSVTNYYDAKLVYINEFSTLVVIRNVTDRFEMIQNLKLAKKKAEESNSVISAFLSNLSHEVRTPLHGILAFAELIKAEDFSIEEKVDFVDNIETAGQQLLAVLNDIIEISKVDAGVVNVNNSEFCLNNALRKVYNMLKATVKNDVEFILNIPEKHRESKPIVYSDNVKFEQIVTNLVNNALKFTNKGKVEFGYENTKGKYFKIYVSDTGIGISKKHQAIIFESFRQVNINDIYKPSGAGLGLAISKAYAGLLRGDITVKSTINKGSTFYLKIPKK